MTGCSDENDKNVETLEQQVEDLLQKMTLEEKVGQMIQYNGFWDATGPVPQGGNAEEKYNNIKNGRVGAMLNVLGVEQIRAMQKLAVENSRLGIPLLFGLDVIHGYKTQMPIPLGEASSWDLQIIEQSARVAAREASSTGLNWTFAPMVDITRDARWGRVMEGAGEDPFLGARVAAARVRGFQGKDLSHHETLAACAKHFAGYGFAEAGREYNTSDMSKNFMHNVVLPPFKAAVDAEVATIMNAFQDISGIPATAHRELQRGVLKKEWAFDGMVVSDWASIYEMVTHGYAHDRRDAALKAVHAGCDMDMDSRCYDDLVQLVREGSVDEKLVDDAARRILRLKFKLGLFEDPYRYLDEQREKKELLSKENLQAAREVAKRSIVLLKNEQKLLPLPKQGVKIAVVGEIAGSKDIPLGSWRAQAEANSAVSLKEGIESAVGPSSEVLFAQGYTLTEGQRSFTKALKITGNDKSGFQEAVDLAAKADYVVMAMGEDCYQSGEGRSQTDIGLKGNQMELFNKILGVNSNVVVVLMNGRPLAIPELAEKAPAILETWFLGSEAGNAIADVLFGDYNPSGKLPMTFPKTVGQIPIYYSRKMTGRPVPYDFDEGTVFWSHYADETNEPLYPFGFGLSYTTFEYAGITVDSVVNMKNLPVKVTITVSNTGKVAGEEVVQLYIRDHVASIVRPVRELKGFQKTLLEPGEKKTLSFELGFEELSFYTPNEKWEVEPGYFDVGIGGSSDQLLMTQFKLVK